MASAPLDGPAGSALTLLAGVERDSDGLSDYLDGNGTDLDASRDFAIASLTLVHFMRLVVIDLPPPTWGSPSNGPGAGEPAASPVRTLLAFESDYDGTLDEHLEELVHTCGSGLRRAYRHCEPAPAEGCSDADLIVYLKGLRVPHAAFHVAHHRRTTARILLEEKIRVAIQAALQDVPRSGPRATPEAVRRAAVAGVPPAWIEALRRAPVDPPATIPEMAMFVGVGALALVAAPLSIPALIAFYVWSSRREEEDAARPRRPPPRRSAAKRLAEREDHQTQNQLTHLVAIKPGALRTSLLRFVLWGVGLLARVTYNQGNLGPMSTIHYARWVVVTRPDLVGEALPALLFFSHNDGSWESYLGDFVEKASKGLSAIWSNTEDFPRTKLLVLEGARDEDVFKKWTRNHQVRTELWFTAYEHLSVGNIRRNAQICQGLTKPPRDLDAWLALL